jgi:hypothetical protein
MLVPWSLDLSGVSSYLPDFLGLNLPDYSLISWSQMPPDPWFLFLFVPLLITPWFLPFASWSLIPIFSLPWVKIAALSHPGSYRSIVQTSYQQHSRGNSTKVQYSRGFSRKVHHSKGFSGKVHHSKGLLQNGAPQQGLLQKVANTKCTVRLISLARHGPLVLMAYHCICCLFLLHLLCYTICDHMLTLLIP